MKIARKRCTAIYVRLTGIGENGEPIAQNFEYTVNVKGEVTPEKVESAVRRSYGAVAAAGLLKSICAEDVIYDIPDDDLEKYIVSRKENE